jgi:hypothetical protein
MSDIVKVDSLSFGDILADLEEFLSTAGELDLSDFNQSSVARRFTTAMASLYNQLRVKIDNTRKESIMDSAIRPESIRYLAMSQLSYNPKRRIAPKHVVKEGIRFLPATEDINKHSVIGNISIDGESYPLTFLEDPLPDYKEGNDGYLVGSLCIGQWKTKVFTINPSLGHLSPFFNFRVEDTPNAIDDSGTVYITVDTTEKGIGEHSEPVNVVSNLYEVMLMTEEEKSDIVLVKSSYFGGLDINFGDGLIFGNKLYHQEDSGETFSEDERGAVKSFTVNYLTTPGRIPNFLFREEDITWDADFVDESVDIKLSLDFGNGIEPEHYTSVKTLSPYISMANQRIMTNEDFISRVRRIPNIRSASSIPRHVEVNDPPDIENLVAGPQSPLVPTATFMLSGLTKISRFPEFDSRAIYTGGSVVSYDGYVWGIDEFINIEGETYKVIEFRVEPTPRLSVRDMNNLPESDWALDGEPVPNEDFTVNGVKLWRRLSSVGEMDFQPLTQAEWDLNFHTQYNFDTLLGFMRVRIITPKVFVELDDLGNPVPNAWSGKFKFYVVLRPFTPGSLTQSQVNIRINNIINDYCWKLGVYLDIGEIIARINDIEEVMHVSVEEPTKSKRLGFDQYIVPSIEVKYEYSSARSRRHKFGNQ